MRVPNPNQYDPTPIIVFKIESCRLVGAFKDEIDQRSEKITNDLVRKEFVGDHLGIFLNNIIVNQLTKNPREQKLTISKDASPMSVMQIMSKVPEQMLESMDSGYLTVRSNEELNSLKDRKISALIKSLNFRKRNNKPINLVKFIFPIEAEAFAHEGFEYLKNYSDIDAFIAKDKNYVVIYMASVKYPEGNIRDIFLNKFDKGEVPFCRGYFIGYFSPLAYAVLHSGVAGYQPCRDNALRTIRPNTAVLRRYSKALKNVSEGLKKDPNSPKMKQPLPKKIINELVMILSDKGNFNEHNFLGKLMQNYPSKSRDKNLT